MATDLVFLRDAAGYAAMYCEENVYRLLFHLRDAGDHVSDGTAVDSHAWSGRAWGLFISNPGRSVAMACQKSGPKGVVVWDYHVVAVVQPDATAAPDATEGLFVCDSDSTLAFPCPFARYLGLSFPADLPPRYAPVFRLLSGSEYLSVLVSDRSHMLDASGRWLAPPPPWPAPGEGSGRPSTLMDLVDMKKPLPGKLLGLPELLYPPSWS